MYHMRVQTEYQSEGTQGRCSRRKDQKEEKEENDKFYKSCVDCKISKTCQKMRFYVVHGLYYYMIKSLCISM